MIVLAVDTAAHICAACLYDSAGHAVLAHRSEDIGRGHAERLFPIIEQVMGQAGRSLNDVDRLAVCVGPGSFTGVRVGVAAMRGLALALDIPLIGISVFDTLARIAAGRQPVLVVMDARRDEVYAQLFQSGSAAADPPQVLSPQAACALAMRSGAALTGSGIPMLHPFLPPGPDRPPMLGEAAAVDMACLAEIAVEREPGPNRPVPLYLRAPDAKPQTGFALPRHGAAS